MDDPRRRFAGLSTLCPQAQPQSSTSFAPPRSSKSLPLKDGDLTPSLGCVPMGPKSRKKEWNTIAMLLDQKMV